MVVVVVGMLAVVAVLVVVIMVLVVVLVGKEVMTWTSSTYCNHTQKEHQAEHDAHTWFALF